MLIAMDSAIALDPVLKRFRDAVAALYGPALDRVVLFGSRARGDARGDSDYDVAVFLKQAENLRAEWNRLTELRLEMADEGALDIEAIPFRVEDYEKRTPLMHEIRKDGLVL